MNADPSHDLGPRATDSETQTSDVEHPATPAPARPGLHQSNLDDSQSDTAKLLRSEFKDPRFRGAFEDAQARKRLVQIVADIRERQGMTQTVLAKNAGTTQSAVSDFEQGAVEPRVATLQRFVRALGGRLELQLWEGPFLLFNSWRHRTLPYHQNTREFNVDDSIARSWFEPAAARGGSGSESPRITVSTATYMRGLVEHLEAAGTARESIGRDNDPLRLLDAEMIDPKFRHIFDDQEARRHLVRYFAILRTKNGLSQTQMAKMTHTSQSAVSEFEKNVTEPRLATLQRYARAFGLRLELQLWEGPFVLFNSWVERELSYETVVARVRINDEMAKDWLAACASQSQKEREKRLVEIGIEHMNVGVIYIGQNDVLRKYVDRLRKELELILK